MKCIRNFNKKGLWHGYQERYYNDKMTFRCNYKNDEVMGYEEYHYFKKTIFHIV